jgi:hypothetical protein
VFGTFARNMTLFHFHRSLFILTCHPTKNNNKNNKHGFATRGSHIPMVLYLCPAIQTAVFVFIFKVCYLTKMSLLRLYSVCDRKIYELAEETEILGEYLPHILIRARTRPLLWVAGDWPPGLCIRGCVHKETSGGVRTKPSIFLGAWL